MKLSKGTGVVVIFDDVEYTDKERELLWGRFFHSLMKLSQKQQKKEITNDECVKTTNCSKNKIPA